MPVNPAYRDFLAVLDAVAGGADLWAAYERHYLSRHPDVVRAYWRQCWGADDERLRQMVAEIRPADHRALREALDAGDVDRLAREALDRCAALLDLREPQVDLLVGRFSPDAFLFDVGGSWHIGVGLERFAHFGGLPLLIAHEYGHYARRMLAGEVAALGDRIVAEGMSIAFGEAAYPERQLARHMRMSARRLHEIRELTPQLWATVKPYLDAPYADEFAGILSGARRWRDFPPRFGGTLGYWAVQAYARRRGLASPSREVLAAPAAVVLGCCGA